jgi:hypothetical protein
MNKQKKEQVKTLLKVLLSDWDILSDIDIKYRLSSIRWKFIIAGLNREKLDKYAKENGKKGAEARWGKVVLKNISGEVKKN